MADTTKISNQTKLIPDLRRLAEEAAKNGAKAPQENLDAQAPEEMRLMFHELTVHQIELEMQNEELQRIQGELEKERARYRDLYDLAPVGYCTLSDHGLIAEANLTAANLLGVTRQALVNKPFSQFIHIEDQDIFYLNHINNCGQGPQVCELRLVKQTGPVLWVHLATNAARNNSGKIERRLVISNINDRKLAEQSFKNSEAQYQRMLDTAQEGIFVLDEHGTTTYINPQTAKLLGYDSKDIVGKSFNYFLYPEDAGDHAQRFAALKQGKNVIYERRLRRKDGGSFWAKVSATTQMDHSGRFIGSFAMLTDITDRKRTEAALKQSEQSANESKHLLKLVLDTIPVRLFWKDLTSTYLGCNRLFAEDAGFQAPEELIGLDDYSMAWRDQADAYRQDDLEVMTSGNSKLQHEEMQTTPDGKQHWLSTSKVPLRDMDDRIIGLLGAYEDITQRKLTEEELLKAQKIESLGVIVGGIAHDFNNILMAVMGNIAFAKTLIPATDKAYERLTLAEAATMKGKDLTRQFLAFTKDGALIKTSISVGKLVRTYGRLTLSGTKSVCQYVIPDDLWRIDADEGQIGQALTNLLMNADQAMQEGGVIEIKCENIQVIEDNDALLKSGPYVKISITDQGQGIAQQNLCKVFDPYFTTKEAGLGLGLASAYAIVKKHGGRLTVESPSGAGATFVMLLPASVSPGETPKIEKITLQQGHGKILIMDDDEMLLDVLGAMLEKLGYETEFALEGNEALEKYTQSMQNGRPFDAVIMDLITPLGMGGKETMEKLQIIDPNAKVIITSGYSNNSVMMDYESYGFSEVISKPYMYSELSRKLYNLLNK